MGSSRRVWHGVSRGLGAWHREWPQYGECPQAVVWRGHGVGGCSAWRGVQRGYLWGCTQCGACHAGVHRGWDMAAGCGAGSACRLQLCGMGSGPGVGRRACRGWHAPKRHSVGSSYGRRNSCQLCDMGHGPRVWCMARAWDLGHGRRVPHGGQMQGMHRGCMLQPVDTPMLPTWHLVAAQPSLPPPSTPCSCSWQSLPVGQGGGMPPCRMPTRCACPTAASSGHSPCRGAWLMGTQGHGMRRVGRGCMPHSASMWCSQRALPLHPHTSSHSVTPCYLAKTLTQVR